MNDTIEIITLNRKGGFDIHVSSHSEHMSLEDLLEDNEIKEITKKIESGELMHFCVRVRASKNNIELGFDYLGGCIYKNLQDFIDSGDYLNDMIDTVVKNAKEAIKSLTE